MSKGVDAANRLGDFARFADALNDQREHTETIVRLALKRVGERPPTDVRDELRTVAHTGISEWSATLSPFRGSTTIACRVRIRSVSGLGTQRHRALYWNITEETDEDLF